MRPARGRPRPGLLLAALTLMLLAGLAGAAGAAPPSVPQDPAYLAFFPPPQAKGQVPVVLHTDPRSTDRVTMISFGVPFPPGFVSDPKQISLVDNGGKELPIRVKVLATWKDPVPGAGSIRAALVQFRDFISVAMPRTYTLRWGAPRLENETEEWPARQHWLVIEDKALAGTNLQEPPVYAVLPKQWLGQALLKGRILPSGSDPKWEFYDHNMGKYFLTAINQFDPRVEKIYVSDYMKDYECWLFDRATTFYVTYIRQGGLEPLRQGVRATQVYGSKLLPDGRFALLGDKEPPDVKFGFQECLALTYWLTGDERALNTSKNVLKLLDTWDPVLSPRRTFWTERHLAFSLLNATVAYEMTGDPQLLERARALFEAGYNAQINPLPGAPKDGCMVHTARQHGEKIEGWLCSSWMSALAVDAMLRYYLVSADPRVAQSIEMLAESLARFGTYKLQGKGEKYPWVVAHYLYGSQPPKDREVYEYNDLQHSLDNLKTVAAANYFLRKQGKVRPELERLQEELFKSAKYDLERWYIKDGPAHGKPEYPLWPKRRYGWMFRTTAELDWLINQK
ncbi:MAG: hypothetical protein HY794_09800 [Desulfarculus sp.]|nr:hypothetical protein [Desulfarculus sp.]